MSALSPLAETTGDLATALRRSLARMATSVVLVTTRHGDIDYGFTASSFTSVSTSPPLVAVFLADTAECFGAFAATERVAINVLSSEQGPLARLFATRGADKFAAFPRHEAHDELPVLRDAMCTFFARVESRMPAGDHLMLLLRVDDVAMSDLDPLVYQARDFRRLS